MLIQLSEGTIDKFNSALEEACNQGAEDLSICLTIDSKKEKITQAYVVGTITSEYTGDNIDIED
jgi:hypothetical protein